MSREIKFRGWQKDTRKMVDLHEITPLAINPEMSTQLAMLGGSGLFLPFLPDIELMQYTGLNDANGVEIFEGDILKMPITKTLQFVRFSVGNYATRFVKVPADGSLYDFGKNTSLAMHVVGNIYENPDLLDSNGGGGE